jgi:hypothetical protein
LDTGFEQGCSQDGIMGAPVRKIRLPNSIRKPIPDLIPAAAVTEGAFIAEDLDFTKGFLGTVRLSEDAGVSQSLVEFKIDLVSNNPILWIVQSRLQCRGCTLKLGTIGVERINKDTGIQAFQSLSSS